MVDDHNPDQTESKPLNTELETLAPEATADHTVLSSESTSNPQHETSAAKVAAGTDSQAGHTATLECIGCHAAD